MRITGGTARGRKLHGPAGGKDTIRPTSDRVREALFNILGDRIDGALVLDLFAGTGALGIEALSRGARHAVFVDRSRRALTLAAANLELCFASPPASLIRLDLSNEKHFRKLRQLLPDSPGFDLIFLDPPYEKKLAHHCMMMVEKAGILAPGGLLVAEERHTVQLPEVTTTLRLGTSRRYGETGIWIYEPASQALNRQPQKNILKP
ncbi:16S rRNA (guanine(966)-N(2))-methyltransferase RsmD [Desulfolithobacter sp.]